MSNQKNVEWNSNLPINVYYDKQESKCRLYNYKQSGQRQRQMPIGPQEYKGKRAIQVGSLLELIAQWWPHELFFLQSKLSLVMTWIIVGKLWSNTSPFDGIQTLTKTSLLSQLPHFISQHYLSAIFGWRHVKLTINI